MRKSIVVVLVALLAACTGPSDPGVSSTPSVESTPDAPPAVIPAEALPVPEPSPWPIQPDERRDRATSSGVPIGQERPFRLYTHCGIDFRVDFDGSFWKSYGVKKSLHLRGGLQIGDPVQKGTMTLLSGEVAVFRYKSQSLENQGQGERIYFVRNDTPKPEGACF